ncbi:unnamed protein product [Clonostachys chloroleuca]|uniref:Zn(2)-C6 fungal-type domain-containing protein n=1 Tax=Clonostachys chloroleuca TaxID=1926264 RepID=A0AA35VLM0_9HYPO|nr:unnamed protein product [Clonostachys chloroleuca]
MTGPAPGTGPPPPSDDIGGGSEDEGPVKKRLRVSRACDPCRRRKERCDGSQPTCQRCIKAGRPCSYIPYRKRGLRTGYVRGIEILLGLLLHSSPGTEELISAVLRHKANQSAPLGPTSAPPTTSLLKSWRKSTAHEILQGALLSSDDDEDEDVYLQNLDDKLTSTFNTLPRQYQNASSGDLSKPVNVISHLPEIISPVASLPFVKQPQPPAFGDLDPNVFSIPTLPPNWSQLIEIYMTNTHCWLPIIQKYTLYRSASLLCGPGGQGQGPKPSSGEICSLWAVLAYGSHQLLVLDPSVTPSGASLYALAIHMANHGQVEYEAGHVHALLTLALLETSQKSWMSAWLCVGRAVYIASGLGIVPPRQGPSMVNSDDSRQRLALGCFVLDTLIASRLGLRPYLQQNDFFDLGTLSSDGIEEWELWRPITNMNMQPASFSPGPSRVLSTFNHFCYIVAILNSLSCSSHHKNETIHPRQYISRLEEWNDRNPLRDCLSIFKDPSKLASEAPHTLQLRLAAMAAYVILSNEHNRQPDTTRETGSSPMAIHNSLAESQRILSDPAINATVVNSTQVLPIARIFLEMVQADTNLITSTLVSASWNRPVLRPGESMQSESIPTEILNDSLAMDEQLLVPTIAIPDSNVFGVVNDEESFSAKDQTLQAVRAAKTIGMSPSTNKMSSPNTSNEPNKSKSPLGSIVTPPLSSQAISQVQVGGMGMENQLAVSNTSLSETSDQNGLFNQLSLLDRADWPVFSEDFMEHLGLSRDGSLLDYHNIFDPSSPRFT